MQAIDLKIDEGTLPHIISVPLVTPKSKIGAVVLFHPHRNGKYITTYYHEIISSSVKEGWAFVSPFCEEPDKLLSMFSLIRAQEWSNKVIVAIGTKCFEVLRYIEQNNISKNLGPDYIFMIHNVPERWWHASENLTTPNLTQSLRSLHTQIEKKVETELGANHEFLEWLRCLNPTYHHISTQELQYLPPLYTMTGWMNSRVDSVIDLIDKSVMTIIGPWKNITGKSLTAALRDWLKFTKNLKVDLAPKEELM
jgi:hypothetical protein